MEKDKKDKKDIKEKVKFYLTLEPLNLKFGAVLLKSETFQEVINFVINQTKKLSVKFEVGKIVENKTNAIILPEYLIGDFLKDDDELTIYSNDYSLGNSSLSARNDISDLYRSKHFLSQKRKMFNQSLELKDNKNDNKNPNQNNNNNFKKNNNNNKNKNKHNNKNNKNNKTPNKTNNEQKDNKNNKAETNKKDTAKKQEKKEEKSEEEESSHSKENKEEKSNNKESDDDSSSSNS